MFWGYIMIGCIFVLALLFIGASVLMAVQEKNRIEPGLDTSLQNE